MNFAPSVPKFFVRLLPVLTIFTIACVRSHAAVPTDAAPAVTNSPERELWQRDYGSTHDQRMKWWREARFGMFIHWGVYSVPAGVWDGTNVTRSGAEWIMNRGRITMAEYQKLPAQFNPVKFNADDWVKLAKAAGMKYIVITSKHHDGFAMFHSQASNFNIYDATPFKRDPLKELADACKKEGIKLGFYYSQAQDWNHPGGAASGGHWDPAQDGSMDDFVDRVDVPQIKELLSNYGPVAVLWWDTPTGMNTERAEKLLPLLKLQPNIISNNRLDSHHLTGDFETPEQRIPATGIEGKDWETCMTINRTWGYRSYDHDWKSTETLVRNLVDIASKGGNYLLNVGPTSEGLIPEPSIERLREIGKWMDVNSVAIYGTTASPFENLKWGRCTKKVTDNGATLYLHVFDWPADGKLLVPGLRNKVQSATLLAGGKKLATAQSADGVTITVPAEAPDKISSTIVMKVDGKLELNQ
jgi:alpha-L-fucosidase